MVDAFVRRAYPFVVLCGLALAAYLQAAGLMTLLGDAYLDVGVSRKGALRGRRAAESSARSGRPILERNPFDSVTGALTRPPESMGDGSPLPASSPLLAPECRDVFAHVVTESIDPTWSAAVLVTTPEAPGVTRRVGDRLGAQQVAFIGYNWLRDSPSVWLESGRGLCQVLLFGKSPQSAPRADVAKVRSGSELPAAIAGRIQQVSATEFHIDRGAVDEVLENQMKYLRSIRVVPDERAGKVLGLKLAGVRPSSLLGSLGLRSGDRLESINGFDVTDPGKALEAYAQMRNAEHLTVKITRGEHPVNVVIRIK